HISDPKKACAEACRVLKSKGRFGFSVWASSEKNPGSKIINEAIEAHANLDVGLPTGPPRYLFEEKEESRQLLEEAGFDGTSISYKTRTAEWHLPNASDLFEAERDAAVRTTGLLARQSPETLDAICIAVEERVRRHAKGTEFVIPM